MQSELRELGLQLSSKQAELQQMKQAASSGHGELEGMRVQLEGKQV